MSATKQPQRLGHLLASACVVDAMLEPAAKEEFLRAVQLERDPDDYCRPGAYGVHRQMKPRKSPRIK